MISAVMIVKNESSCLEKCLNSIKGVDEIVICDTGSEDNTVEIAKRFTDKVYTDYKWNDNFAEARNHALSKATGDWILVIDADETLESSINELKEWIKKADAVDGVRFNTISARGKEKHFSIRLHRKGIYWKGAIHNYLNTTKTIDSDLVIKYGYSEAHKKDPDRALRILTKVCKDNPNAIREKYYLAREHWYRKDYKTAIEWYKKYLEVATWLPERADAYLMLARCYWNTAQGDKAREACAMAIVINANFKEAINFMAVMSWEHNAIQWKKMAETANNNNVLFIR